MLAPIAFVAAGFLLLRASAATAAGVVAPQRLDYRVAWNGLGAATALVTVSRAPLGGTDAFFVEGTAWTNRVVDIFWRFRGKAQATVLTGDLRPLRFRFDRTANRRIESTWLEFDWRQRLARGVHVKRGKRRERDIDASMALDPFTAALSALARPIAPGDSFTTRVFTGESLYAIDFEVRKEETVTVPAGRFDAYQVEPTIWKITTEQQKDRRLRKATLWVTKDTPRALLRVRSEVFIGAVTLELTNWSKPAPTSPSSRELFALRPPTPPPWRPGDRDSALSRRGEHACRGGRVDSSLKYVRRIED